MSRIVMKKPALIMMVSLLLLAVYAIAASAAVMYKYVDDNGDVVLTDNRGSIPQKYQRNVEVVKDDDSHAHYTPESKLTSLTKGIKHVWDKIPFKKIWPMLAAALGVIVALVVSQFIISDSRRKLMLFFSVLTALTFVLVMYTMVMK